MRRGARIDAIGLQGHVVYARDDPRLHEILTNPGKLFATLDLYGQYGLPIQISEITLAVFSDKAEDEEAQAELLKQLYTLYFSHKNVEAIIFWDLADGYTPGAAAGDMNSGWNLYRGSLLRFDLSEKPAFRMLKHLVKEVWHTDTVFRTDENGKGGFHGFFGTYKFQIDTGAGPEERTIDFLNAEKGEITIQL